MSQRNPLNERNSVQRREGQLGKTRRSAASAKPVAKAASSVYIPDPKAKKKKSFFDRFRSSDEEEQPKKKKAPVAEPVVTEAADATAEGGAAKKKRKKYTLSDLNQEEVVSAEGASKEARKEANRRYRNPGTTAYRKWRNIWWVVIIAGICSLVPPIVNPDMFVDNATLTYIFFFLGWAFLLAAIFIDAIKIRPLRQKASGRALAEDRSKAATKARKQAKREAAAREQERANKKAAKKAKRAR